MRALSTAFVLLAVAVAAASLFWHPVRLESVPFRMGALPTDLVANNRIAEHMQRFFVGQFQAPEHFTFDSHGNIYFSVHDGRILRVQVAPSGELGEPELVVRTGEASLADRGHPCGSEASENVCGRPLGMAIDPTNEHKLIVADCYLGLLEVDTREKSKKVLVNSVDGAAIYFANSVVVSAHSGIIYFTDSSSRWRRRDFIYEVLESQPTGRVISFDRRSGEARVLVQRVAFSNGILLDPANEQFLLFNELNRARVLRYDLSPQHMSGDGSGAIDVQQALAGVEDERTASKSARLTVAVANLPGIPDNLAWEQGSKDCFWIGAGTKRTQPFSLTDALAGLPLVRTALAAVLPKQAFLKLVPRIGLLFRVQLDAARQHGRVVDVLQDNTGRTALLTGAYEHDGFLYLGAISHEVDYLARLPWTSSNKTGATPSHTA